MKQNQMRGDVVEHCLLARQLVSPARQVIYLDKLQSLYTCKHLVLAREGTTMLSANQPMKSMVAACIGLPHCFKAQARKTHAANMSCFSAACVKVDTAAEVRRQINKSKTALWLPPIPVASQRNKK